MEGERLHCLHATAERMLTAIEGLGSQGQMTHTWQIKAEDFVLQSALERRSFALEKNARNDFIFHQL